MNEKSGRLGVKDRRLIVAILMLASIHCVKSIFFVNSSYLSLERYETGTERLPYQARCLMVPVLRWARGNQMLIRLADAANRRGRTGVEPQTPEKLAMTLLGVLCVVGLGLLLTAEARRRRMREWWLPWTLMLAMLYAGDAARWSENFWYPWDLPQCFLLGLGSYLVVRRWWVPLLTLMPVLTLNRETAVFLPVLWLMAGWESRGRARLMVESSVLAAVWLTVRIAVLRVYAGRSSETGSRLVENVYRVFEDPLRWVQIASGFGFLMPLLLLHRGNLSQESRRLLRGVIACLAVVLWYGIWYETRIFIEFAFLFAMLAAEAWENRVGAAPVSGSLMAMEQRR